MSIGRLVIGIVVVLVLYSVITQPLTAAAMTRNGAGQLGEAGNRATQFITALVGGTQSGDTVVPTGGVAAGDGSSAP